MLPNDTTLPLVVSFEIPPWTNPTSTADFGSFRRSRFSADPPEGTIFRSTPAFRIRILRYFIAFVWNAPPSGPLVIVMVLGGARWKNRKTANTRIPAAPTTAATAIQRLTPKISAKGFQSRPKTDFRPFST